MAVGTIDMTSYFAHKGKINPYCLSLKIISYIYTPPAKDILETLYADGYGWLEKDQKGSHLQLVHPTKSGKVTVSMHKGDLPKGTINSILKQAGLK